MKTSQPFIIFSAFENGIEGKHNLERDSRVRELLSRHSIQFESVVGSYNGEKELSLLVADTTEIRAIVDLVCILYNQESILACDANKRCRLEFTDPDRSPVELGLWREITENSTGNSWSRINGRYFTTT